jgi:g-D-glutamyl-meso-diaminopimelate peptidase
MQLLTLGAAGSAVDLLQTALRRGGYLPDAPDGLFGPRTRRGVADFQRNRGLDADGLVGPRTWDALRPLLTGYSTRRVRPGDTPYTLARAFGTTAGAILAANPGLRPENLQIGQRLTIPLGFPVVPTDVRYSSALAAYCAEGLAARYPFLRRGSVGRSVLGRELTVLTVGAGPRPVLYQAAHHANEWITAPVLLRFLEDFCGIYAANAAYRGITLHILPMVNPDGVDLVTGFLPEYSPETLAAQEMNPSNLPFPDGWKANIRGVDLNLNYPAGWEQAKEIKYAQGYTAPGPRDFVGPRPLSEPESAALAAYTERVAPRLTLSYHTQGEVIYWKYDGYLPPHSLEITQKLSEVSGYAYEETPAASGSAGYKDWYIQQYNRPGCTIECGRGVNPLPISQFPEIYKHNLPLLLTAATLAE